MDAGVLDFLQLLMQYVPFTTDVASSNLGQVEVYNIMW
jgi:hypothetical protein